MLQIILLLLGAGFFFALITFSITSVFEKEYIAFRRSLLLAFTTPLPYLFLAFTEIPTLNIFSSAVAGITILAIIILLLPINFPIKTYNDTPNRIDERDIMFSRAALEPNSKNYSDYYSRKPKNKIPDDKFRQKPGLMSENAQKYEAVTFAAADANFETIGHLKFKIDGLVSEQKKEIDKTAITKFLKKWAKQNGMLNSGITELKDYHLYSVRGREFNYGQEVKKEHKYAIAFTVEMRKEMIDCAPEGPTLMESSQQYLSSGVMAVQMAQFIRNLGFSAKAHIDGNYEIIAPLVARDAGLGEIGRMGLLMTPRQGPRVRIAVVTTDLPLNTDSRKRDRSMIDFCRKCKKCAKICPSNSISHENEKMIDGVRRWQINSEKCFTYWCQIGTDCTRCMVTCPYSHHDNFVHNVFRFFIRRSSVFRIFAVYLDDFFYTKKPKPKEVPEWIKPFFN